MVNALDFNTLSDTKSWMLSTKSYIDWTPMRTSIPDRSACFFLLISSSCKASLSADTRWKEVNWLMNIPWMRTCENWRLFAQISEPEILETKSVVKLSKQRRDWNSRFVGFPPQDHFTQSYFCISAFEFHSNSLDMQIRLKNRNVDEKKNTDYRVPPRFIQIENS